MLSRDTESDMRAKEKPLVRQNIHSLIKANAKRVQEALRVLEEYTGHSSYNQLRYDMYDIEKTLLLHALKPQFSSGIYLISDSVETLERGLSWGVSLIQLRDKFASKSDILAKAKDVKALSNEHKTPFIINDFLDIALRVDADGLHTGQDDIPVHDLRQILGPHKLLGRTSHTLEQGLLAQEQGADYVSVGPIWDTPSKPGRPGIGLDYLKRASTELHIPYVAIGGVSLSTMDHILPYKPPLIGLIRDVDNIPLMQEKIKQFNN